MSYDYQDPLDAAPEDMTPDALLVPLVGVTRHGEFNYYVLPRHLLYLDGRKSVIHGNDSAFREGMPGRFNIMIVNEANEEAFFNAIEPYKRSLARLRDEVYACKNKYWRANYFVEVLIDFDRKHLASYFGEPYYFEKDVPDGWTSERAGYGCSEDYYFMDDGPDGKPESNIGIGGLEKDYIPLDKRFWIDVNGKSIFNLLYEEGLRNGTDKPPIPFPPNRIVHIDQKVFTRLQESVDEIDGIHRVDLDWIPEDVQFWTVNNEKNLYLCLYDLDVRSGRKKLPLLYEEVDSADTNKVDKENKNER